jgi:imidazolonepropionase-like amidohydrolase
MRPAGGQSGSPPLGPPAPLVIRDVRVYASPDATPLDHASILIRDGKIAAMGQSVSVPRGARELRCENCTVLAGFWNCHVHFTEPKWDDAANQPAGKLADALQQMLTHSGFTTVVDTGSDPRTTLPLRRRIESGEVPGPRIFTAGAPLYPPDGIPYYIRENAPQLLPLMSAPKDPEEAAQMVASNIARGADLVKLFTGSWVKRGQVLPMPVPIATAAVRVAHQHHQLVFAHPSSLAGVQVAIASGVDVLAHAPDDTRGVTDSVIQQAIDHHMAMIPTLQLFSGEAEIPEIRAIVRKFHDRGGKLLFGTDTGYLPDYDVSEEYRQLSGAGIDAREVLRMLTENPAAAFNVANHAGRIAAGYDADLTVVEGDPAAEIAAFTRIRYTIRNGRILWSPSSAAKPEPRK